MYPVLYTDEDAKMRLSDLESEVVSEERSALRRRP